MGDIGLDKWISRMESHKRRKHKVVMRAVDYREEFFERSEEASAGV